MTSNDNSTKLNPKIYMNIYQHGMQATNEGRRHVVREHGNASTIPKTVANRNKVLAKNDNSLIVAFLVPSQLYLDQVFGIMRRMQIKLLTIGIEM